MLKLLLASHKKEFLSENIFSHPHSNASHNKIDHMQLRQSYVKSPRNKDKYYRFGFQHSNNR